MKYFEEIVATPELPEELSVLCDGRAPMFFDIETTGLSPARSYVYLIGSLAPCKEHWLLRQWFSESPEEEASVLESFAHTITTEHRLVHYNGATFDLPFLAHRMSHHGLSCSVPDKADTLDLMRHLAGYKKWYGLSNRKQRTLEPLAGYERQDPYDGGTLIAFYAEYVGKARFDARRAEELLADLLRHNREDLLGLASLPRLFATQRLLNGSVANCEVLTADTASDGQMTVSFTLPTPLTAPLALTLPIAPDGCPEHGTLAVHLQAEHSTGTLALPMYEGTAKHYFPNYKDYYYLPLENRSIHRSIAGHIPAAYRKVATKDTAYESYRGTFLPQYETIYTPAFSLNRTCSVALFPMQELSKQPEKLLTYVAHLLVRFASEGIPD